MLPLNQAEVLDVYAHKNVINEPNSLQRKDEIGFSNAVFSWSSNTGSSSSSERRFELKISGELFFRRGQINLVVGPTGSGKTSLLMALLGKTSPCSLFCHSA